MQPGANKSCWTGSARIWDGTTISWCCGLRWHCRATTRFRGAELAELGTLIAAEELELYPPGMALSEKCFPGKVR